MTDTVTDSIHKGSCFCGSVTFTVVGKPILSAYCHCTLCQRLNVNVLYVPTGLAACPFIHTIHFPGASFTWTPTHDNSNSESEGRLDTFEVTDKPWKHRKRCTTCGSNVASYNTKTDTWSVWGATFERDGEGKMKDWDELKATAHMFYGTRVLDIEDGIGKWAGYEGRSERM